MTDEEARKQAEATLWGTDHPAPARALADHVFAGKPGGLSLSRKLSEQQEKALREQLWDREDEENRQAEDRPGDRGGSRIAYLAKSCNRGATKFRFGEASVPVEDMSVIINEGEDNQEIVTVQKTLVGKPDWARLQNGQSLQYGHERDEPISEIGLPNMSQEHSDREGPPEHPMPAPPGSPLIYVDNLEASMDNEALYDIFSLFGGVLSCKVACDEDGKSKRSGVVHLESADSAQEASERVDGMQIGERAVVVKQLSNAEARSFLSFKCGGAFVSFLSRRASFLSF